MEGWKRGEVVIDVYEEREVWWRDHSPYPVSHLCRLEDVVRLVDDCIDVMLRLG